MKASLALIALAALLAVASVAAAQESNETKTEEQSEPRDGGNAWTEDCPPDMMCAYGGSSEEPTEPKEDNATTRGPADCEYCRGGDAPTSNESDVQDGGNAWVEDCPEGMMCAADSGSEPIPYGPEGCIECSAPPTDDANTEADPVNTAADDKAAETDATQKSVPGLGILAVAGAFAAVAVLALVRRS